MSWNVWVVNTVNGTRRHQIPVTAFSWERALNGGASGRATVNILDEVVSKLQLFDLSIPMTRTWVLSWNDTAVYGGIVQKRSYDRSAGTLSVTLADVWSVFEKRIIWDHSKAPEDIAGSVVSYAGLSLGTIAKRIVENIQGIPANDRALSIEVPAESSGTAKRKFYGYHAPNALDALQDIMESRGGPDIDFKPAWVATSGQPKFVWQMRVGALNTGRWEWNLDAPQCDLTGVLWEQDATMTTNSVFVSGEGSEKNIMMTRIAESGSGYHQDSVESFPEISDWDQMESRGNARLEATRSPTTTWQMSSMANGVNPVSAFQLGGTVVVDTTADPILPTGRNLLRLIRYSGDLGYNIKLGVQEVF